MSVYVDDMRMPAKVGRLNARWSHLMADTEEELIAFATLKLGMRRSWLQRYPSGVHFDLTDNKRTLAIRAGAVPIECGSEEWMRVHRLSMEQFGTEEERRAAFQERVEKMKRRQR